MRIPRRFFAMSALWLASIGIPAFGQIVLHSGTFGGGASAATDGRSLMGGTIAQTVIGPVANSTNMVGQGFWYTLPVLSTTSVNYPPALAGSGLVLHQNIPNPFSTATTIAFDLPKSGPVSLKMFDAVGHEVRTLIDETREAGRITTTVDAHDLESGHYTARLVANGVTRTMMMVVVK